MYVWFDYISIPQPGALTKKLSAEMVAALDANGDGQISQDELKHSPVTKTQDHRLMTETDAQVMALVEQLKAAVDSIPSYLERSALMWILVPPVEHRDLDGVICDFNSWRSRGWCRMEFAAKLATGEDMKIMLIQDTGAAATATSSSSTRATRSSSPRPTTFRRVGPTKVNTKTMLQAKSAYYEQLGDKLLSHSPKSTRPSSSPTGGQLRAAADRRGRRRARAANEGAASKMRRFLKWDTEAAEAEFAAETGWNELMFACCLDDEAAVDELLASTAEDPKRGAMINAKAKKLVQQPGAKKLKYAHRVEPSRSCLRVRRV